MDYLRKLKGHQRSAPGLEWKIFRKLPWCLLASAAVPLLIALGGRAFPPDGATAEVAKRISTLDIFSFAIGLTAWSATITIGIACFVVMVMKGPAYVADGYSPDDAKYLPTEDQEN